CILPLPLVIRGLIPKRSVQRSTPRPMKVCHRYLPITVPYILSATAMVAMAEWISGAAALNMDDGRYLSTSGRRSTQQVTRRPPGSLLIIVACTLPPQDILVLAARN